MILQDSLLVTLVQLIDRLPLPAQSAKAGRGRPKIYSDRIFLKAVAGNLTEGLTVFELKDGKLMRRVGIGVCHPSKAAPDAASSINSLEIGSLMPACQDGLHAC
jgi:hypothetical protein